MLYSEEIRLNELLQAVNMIGLARMHVGASETEDFQIPFEEVYNSVKKQDIYGYRSKKYLFKKGFEEIEEAKAHFRNACIACPLKGLCGHDSDNIKKYREDVFYKLLSNPKIRVRFRNRLKKFVDNPQKDKELVCSILMDSKRI